MSDEAYQPFPDVSAWTAVPFDPTTYEQYAALLEQARAEATEEAREHAVRTAIRYAGTDTGAIEGLYTTDRGFTRTVAIEAAHWEAAANERGPNAAEIIKDQIAAYEWVLDLVTEKRPVTEHMIRELHAMLCRSQETYVVHTAVGRQERPLPKGEYKEHPNNPTSATTGKLHHYAPPDMVGPEMARLVASLSSDEYVNAHPVVQAAYLHYALAAIHPFADGNGRVSRALASVPLYRALRVPLVVFADERDAYLDALAAADAQDLMPFPRFVAERVVDAVDVVVLTLRVGGNPEHTQSIARFREIIEGTGNRALAELDAMAGRLIDVVHDEAQKRVADTAFPPTVSCDVHVRRGHVRGGVTDGYRPPLSAPRHVSITASTDDPVHVWFGYDIWAAIKVGNGDGPPLLLHSSSQGPVTFGFRDVEPQVREVARIKVATLVDAVLADLFFVLAEDTENKLRGIND